jgi:hypothetical protein
LSEDGFEEDISGTLVGVCGRGVDIVDILEDLKDIY